MSKNINLISFVGNVGSGKSTIAGYLSEQLGTVALLEKPANFLFLEDSFANPERWSFHNQSDFILVKYFELINNGQQHSFLIQEMDLVATHKIWTPVFRKLNYITLKEEILINNIFNVVLETLELKHTLNKKFVFVHCPREIILDRIIKRGRYFEQNNINEMSRLVEILDEQILSFFSENSKYYRFDNGYPSFQEAIEKNQSFISELTSIVNE